MCQTPKVAFQHQFAFQNCFQKNLKSPKAAFQNAFHVCVSNLHSNLQLKFCNSNLHFNLHLKVMLYCNSKTCFRLAYHFCASNVHFNFKIVFHVAVQLVVKAYISQFVSTLHFNICFESRFSKLHFIIELLLGSRWNNVFYMCLIAICLLFYLLLLFDSLC